MFAMFPSESVDKTVKNQLRRPKFYAPSTGHRALFSPRSFPALAALHTRRRTAVRQLLFRNRRAILRRSWRMPDVSTIISSFASTCILWFNFHLYILNRGAFAVSGGRIVDLLLALGAGGLVCARASTPPL